MANPQLTARVSEEFAARIDALVMRLNTREEHRALPLDRTDVVRIALARGVDMMERELGAPAPASKVAAKRGKR